ncbi:hypothetical protein [Francisella marina]|uniref:hypothetical protein n=1 Tax=Francisella marina TaxID=2249302 RepID=UPI0011EFD3F3|nr:hypothetical protein [Francisella marina]QEO59614.1 hypothetical protein F0R75_07375 [Francisella marina]
MRKQKKKNISSDAWSSKIVVIVLAVIGFSSLANNITFEEVKVSLNIAISGSINTPSSSH